MSMETFYNLVVTRVVKFIFLMSEKTFSRIGLKIVLLWEQIE